MLTSATIPDLLALVSTLAAQHRARRQATGEDFNIFRILGLQTAEVRTHSAFLAELLNPAGSHGMGATFLKILLQQMGDPDPDLTAGVRVEVEKHIGFLNEDSSTGGRIDICLYPPNGAPIFIENKIYAGDQKNQLLRYHNHDPSARLWYLTLNGAEPGKFSTDGKVPVDRCLSYENDIVRWLEACRKEAAGQPLIRETITQYIHLLKELTGQSADHRLMAEIKQLLLRNPEHLASAQLIGKAYESIRADVGHQIRQALDAALDPLIRELTLPGHANGVFLELGEYKVRLAHDVDGDGYFWGFPAVDSQGKIDQCRRPELDELAAVLRGFDPRFGRTPWWIGWVNPLGYARIDRCSPEQVAKLAGSDTQQALATETARQTRACVQKIKEHFATKG